MVLFIRVILRLCDYIHHYRAVYVSQIWDKFIKPVGFWEILLMKGSIRSLLRAGTPTCYGHGDVFSWRPILIRLTVRHQGEKKRAEHGQ